MTERVLVPLDVSEQSKEALRWACSEYPEKAVTVLHVVDPRLPGHMPGVELEEDGWEDESYAVEAAKRYAEKTAEELDVGVEIDVVEGVNVSRKIVEHAEEGGFDHVVIGSHGRTGATRVLLGSVAENVVRRSPTPVTVVR